MAAFRHALTITPLLHWICRYSAYRAPAFASPTWRVRKCIFHVHLSQQNPASCQSAPSIAEAWSHAVHRPRKWRHGRRNIRERDDQITTRPGRAKSVARTHAIAGSVARSGDAPRPARADGRGLGGKEGELTHCSRTHGHAHQRSTDGRTTVHDSTPPPPPPNKSTRPPIAAGRRRHTPLKCVVVLQRGRARERSAMGAATCAAADRAACKGRASQIIALRLAWRRTCMMKTIPVLNALFFNSMPKQLVTREKKKSMLTPTIACLFARDATRTNIAFSVVIDRDGTSPHYQQDIETTVRALLYYPG